MKAYWRLSRPFTMLTPLIGMVAGGLAAAHDLIGREAFQLSAIEAGWRVGLAAIAAAWLNSASNALNQICDIEIDRVAKPERPIPSGAITMRGAKTFTALSYLASLALAFICGGLLTFAIFAFAALAPRMEVISPWKDREFLQRFQGRGDLLRFVG